MSEIKAEPLRKRQTKGSFPYATYCEKQGKLGKIVLLCERVFLPRSDRSSGAASATAGDLCGDTIDVGIMDERSVLTMRPKRIRAVKIIADPVTGSPVLSAGADAPTLSGKDVDEMFGGE